MWLTSHYAILFMSLCQHYASVLLNLMPQGSQIQATYFVICCCCCHCFEGCFPNSLSPFIPPLPIVFVCTVISFYFILFFSVLLRFIYTEVAVCCFLAGVKLVLACKVRTLLLISRIKGLVPFSFLHDFYLSYRFFIRSSFNP